MIPATSTTLYLVSVIGVFGLLIGSFLNVVVYRVPAGTSLIPGSKCPKCDAPVRPWHNIPVLSWLLLRGKCASCQAPISIRYPLVEAATAIVFAGITWWLIGSDANDHLSSPSKVIWLIALLYLAAVSIGLTLIDLDTFRLPNVIVLPSLAVVALLCAANAYVTGDGGQLLRALAGGLILMLFYGILWFFWPGGMGLGDVKLAGLLGLMLAWIGWGALVAGAFAAFVCGGIFGVCLLLLGRAGRRSRIPFGPWMLLGAWVGIFWGEPLVGWYMNTFLA